MPEEDRSNTPSRNPDSQSLGQDPRANLPEQSVMGNKPATHSDQQEKNSESPSGRVHWINYATFFLSVILAVLTAGTIRVYYLQLNQMIIVTRATQNAAYDACMSAKIARQTLLDYQTGEADAHSAASGTVAQASAVIRSEAGILNMGTIHMPEQGDTSPNPKEWRKLGLSFSYSDTGKSSIRNARIRYTVQILPHDTEPQPDDKSLYFNPVFGAVINPGEVSFVKPNIIDKDNKFIDPDAISMDDFHSGKIYIASFGRAAYNDIFGVSHWQTFCGFFDAHEPTDQKRQELIHRTCGTYNRQDSNLLYPLPPYSTPNTTPSVIEEIVCTPPHN